MGEIEVPEAALYGASTQRAVLNFQVSGRPMPREFIRALGLVKWACSRANHELGLIDSTKAVLIETAALEIASGDLTSHFPIDVFQTGSGTSTNMNANEVIANRAAQIDGSLRLHPNDDVNLSQSSNDVIPTVLHVSIASVLRNLLGPSLAGLAEKLEAKSRQWSGIVKIGRTHFMDATPLTLGQEFSGYAFQVRKAGERAERAVKVLLELAIGGTAVGTGVNAHPSFGGLVAKHLADRTGIPFREADNHFAAQAARDDCIEVAGDLLAIATALAKVANDIRLMGSGPRAGLAELKLPPTQPGSSIMPGKVNPVMCEMLIQTCIYVSGLMSSVELAAHEAYFELNVGLPLLGYCFHEAVGCLSNAINGFTQRCVSGLEADPDRCAELVARSLMLVTSLNPYIGYDAAASVAKEALQTGRTLREIIISRGLISPERVDAVLDPIAMTRPGMPGDRHSPR